MLRVAITGGAGSGKSTIAAMFAARGAHTCSSDEVARQLMQPGQPVFQQIVDHFGAEVLATDGTLNRSHLAKLAFAEGRVRELEAIIHPAVLAWQAHWFHQIAAQDPSGVAIVESALIFESNFTTVAEKRFDRILLVTASPEAKRRRFIARALQANPSADAAQVAADADRRLALQIDDASKEARADFILRNDRTLADVLPEVDRIWQILKTESVQTTSK